MSDIAPDDPRRLADLSGTRPLVVYKHLRNEKGEITAAIVMMRGHDPVTLLPGDSITVGYHVKPNGDMEEFTPPPHEIEANKAQSIDLAPFESSTAADG